MLGSQSATPRGNGSALNCLPSVWQDNLSGPMNRLASWLDERTVP